MDKGSGSGSGWPKKTGSDRIRNTGLQIMSLLLFLILPYFKYHLSLFKSKGRRKKLHFSFTEMCVNRRTPPPGFMDMSKKVVFSLFYVFHRPLKIWNNKQQLFRYLFYGHGKPPLPDMSVKSRFFIWRLPLSFPGIYCLRLYRICARNVKHRMMNTHLFHNE